MTPVDKAQQERFLREIVPAAVSLCPQFGRDPKQCIMEAAVASSCGRFAIGFNWWNLQGQGDGGFYTLTIPVRTGDSRGGGWASRDEQIAKFASPASAVQAWCKARGA